MSASASSSARTVVVLALALVAASACAAPYTTMLAKESMPAKPSQWVPLAKAPEAAPVTMHVFVRQQNLGDLERTLYAVSDPESPLYGAHLSRDEVAELVAPAPEDLVAVLAWLQHHGVDTSRDVTAVAGSDILAVSTTYGRMAEMLGTGFQVFRHAETGEHTVRVSSGYSLPAEVHGAIDFVGPTTRFPNRFGVVTPSSKSKALSPEFGVTPDVLRALYKVNNATGSGSADSKMAVASFLGQYMSSTDLQSFYSTFAKPLVGTKPTIIGDNQVSQPGVEASLDIQYINGVGQGVSSVFYSTPGQQPHNPGSEPFLTWLYLVANETTMPHTISISYGDNEDTVWMDYAVRVNAEFQKLGARGITILASSGDGGVAGGQSSACNGRFIPTYPAASPYVTAVGGTTGSAPETAASFSSGGFSDYWARPSYQSAAVSQYLSSASNLPPTSYWNQTGAGFPDVSAQGEFFLVVVDGIPQPVDGTSCSSPTFAGVIGLINDKRVQAGKPGLGWLNPMLYSNAGIFNDVTSGSNPGCGTNGFSCAAGWDPVTGLGTPDYQKLEALSMTL